MGPRVARAFGLMLISTTLWISAPRADAQADTGQDRSAIDDYYQLKATLKDRYGLDVGVKESLMFQQRGGTSLADGNYDFNGQFDAYLDWSLFGDTGRLYILYMNIHQLGGITTTAFGERNGNITPINDSDPNSLLRFLMYQHRFGPVTLMGGKFESMLLFAANRYAADDRTTFMALPLVSVGAKDRTFSSLGFAGIVQAADWLSIGGALNSLDFSRGISGEPFGKNGFYSILNATATVELAGLGEGVYRVNWVHSEGQVVGGMTLKASNGLIVSADQDLGDTFSAFLRIDNTDIQTAASPLVESYSGGIAVRKPFRRDRDIVSAGVFHTKSEQRGNESEDGFEVFYRLGLTQHIDLTANLQGYWPARAEGFFVVPGLRLMVRF